MTTTARVAAVNTLPLGSVISVSAGVGATALAVEDAADFDEAGGVVIIGDTEIVTFVSADDESGILTLAAPTTVAWDVDTRIELWDATAATRVVETVAQVLVEGADQGGDSLEAVVDHTLIPFLPEGIRETGPETGLVGEAVAIEWRGEELVVVNIIGQAPVMNGAVIDPSTIPGSLPSVPTNPSAPTIIGGLGTLFARWDAVTHPNPVTYAVYASDVTPVVPSVDTFVGEVSGTLLTVKRLPKADAEAGTPYTNLKYDHVYYVTLVAKDSTDPTFASALSPEGSGTPVQVNSGDLAVNSVIAGTVAAGAISGESFAGEVFLGSRFTTADTGARSEFDPQGIRLYDSSNLIRVNLPTDPAVDAEFRGKVQADGLTVRGAATFFSTLNAFSKDSVINLEEQVAAPLAAPTVSTFWQSTQLSKPVVAGSLGSFALDMALVQSAAWNPSLNIFHLVQKVPSGGARIWYYTLAGANTIIWDMPDSWDVTSVGLGSDGEFRILFKWASKWWVYDYSKPAGSRQLEYTPSNPSRRPLMAMDGTDLWITETNASNDLIFRRMDTSTSPMTVAGGVVTTGAASSANNPSFFYRGSADFGSARLIAGYRNSGDTRVFGTGGAYTAPEAFPVPVARAGGFWNPTTSRFYTVGTDGRIYTHSDLAWTSSTLDTWHLAQTFRDSVGTTHETMVGAVRTFNPVKRAWQRVQLAQVPYAGGADDPDSWRIYGKTGTAPPPDGTGMRLQASGSYTVLQYDFSTPLSAVSSLAPAASNFPGATPARMKSGRVMPLDPTKSIFEVRGDGSGRWGPFEVDGTGTIVHPTPWTNAGLTAGTGVTLDAVEYMVDALGRVSWRGGLYAAGTAPAANAVVLTIPAAIQPTLRGTWEVGGLNGTLVLYVGVYGGSGGALNEIRFRRVSSGAWGTSSATSSSLAQLSWPRA